MNDRPRRRFGQNFLHDRNIVEKIVAAVAPRDTDRLVEIGPGRGALTEPLLTHVSRLDAIEIDNDLADHLESQLETTGLVLHRGDALRFDYSSLFDGTNALRIVGNLPYNISSPLLFRWLDASHLISDIHVMLQKEVVDRMAAGPGSKVYGRLSIAVGARCKVEPLFTIQPGSFRPAPNVESAFARITPVASMKARITNAKCFDDMLRQVFSRRRKTMANAIHGLADTDTLDEAGIDPRQRPEQVSIDQFVRLANLINR